MVRRTLIVCGILASLLYVAMNVFVPMRWPEYNSATYTVSELSAIGAPTRSLWVPLGILYALLMTGFGYGVWASLPGHRPLRVAGGLLVLYGILCLAWPPMHPREVLAAGGATLTDTMHIAFAAAAVFVMFLAMGFGGVAVGKRFTYYSLASIATLLLFGALTFLEAPNVDKNLPTPWIGVWERINIGVFLVWVIVLAAILLPGPRGNPAGSHDTQAH